MRKQNKVKSHLRRKATQEEILQLLRYDKKTGYFYWKLPRGSLAKAGDIAGTDTGSGVVINVNGRRYKRSDLVWFLEVGHWPEDKIAHVDRDRNNDCVSNLCESSPTETLWHDKIKTDDEPDGLLLTSESKTVIVFEGSCFGVYKNRRTAQQIYGALHKLRYILNGRK